jgi:hypothetical protein
MSSYDAIAIGDELATLLAAGLLARRGARVVLICPSPEGIHLTSPPVPLVIGHASARTIQRVFQELELSEPFSALLSPLGNTLAAPPQVVLPDARFDLDGEQGFRASVARELKGAELRAAVESTTEELRAVSRALEELLSEDLCFPADSFWSRRQEHRRSARLPCGPLDRLTAPTEAAARALLAAPAWLGCELDPANPTALAMARSLDGWLSGLHMLLGGRGALAELVLGRLAQLGVERRPWPSVLRLHGGLVGVRSVELDDGVQLRGETIVVGAPLARLLTWTDSPPRKLRELNKAVVPVGYRYVLHARFHEAGIPEGIGSCVAARSSLDSPAQGDNMLSLQLAPPDENGLVALTASALVPAQVDGSIPDFSSVRPLLWSRTAELMPFCERHLVVADSPHDRLPPLGRGGTTDAAAPAGKLVPTTPTAVWSSTVDHALDIAAAPLRVGWSNVIVATRQNVPALGLEGELITAWSAARLATDLLSSTLTKRSRRQSPEGSGTMDRTPTAS